MLQLPLPYLAENIGMTRKRAPGRRRCRANSDIRTTGRNQYIHRREFLRKMHNVGVLDLLDL